MNLEMCRAENRRQRSCVLRSSCSTTSSSSGPIAVSCCSKLPNACKVINPSEQELKLPVRGARSVLRDLVARQRNSDKREAALRVRLSVPPATTDDAHRNARDVLLRQGLVKGRVDGRVVRHVEVFGERRLLEALGPLPGHVVDHGEGAVGRDQEVQLADGDDDVARALDDGGERAEGRGLGAVEAEVVGLAHPEVYAGPVDVQRVLHVAAVEVVVWAPAERREAELVGREGARLADVVGVEAWVDVQCGGGDVQPEPAVVVQDIGHVDGIGEGECAIWRECQRLLHEGCVSAVLGALVDCLCEGVVEVEVAAVLVEVLH